MTTGSVFFRIVGGFNPGCSPTFARKRFRLQEFNTKRRLGEGHVTEL